MLIKAIVQWIKDYQKKKRMEYVEKHKFLNSKNK